MVGKEDEDVLPFLLGWLEGNFSGAFAEKNFRGVASERGLPVTVFREDWKIFFGGFH